MPPAYRAHPPAEAGGYAPGDGDDKPADLVQIIAGERAEVFLCQQFDRTVGGDRLLPLRLQRFVQPGK